MNRATQGILLTLLGTVLLRLAFSDAYLQYVNTWMKWPLVVSGCLLILLAITDLLPSVWRAEAEHEVAETGAATSDDVSDDPDHAHMSHAAWLLFAPILVVFLVAPPALGAYLAERAPAPPAEPTEEQLESTLSPLPEEDPAPVTVTEFYVRARYDEGRTLPGRQVAMTGFVSLDGQGEWYVTRFGINCCAADSSVTRVRAEGVEAPPRDQWVRVTGSWVEGSGIGSSDEPALTVSDVVEVEAPKFEYE